MSVLLAAAGAVLLAALSTLYDFLWAYFSVQHRPEYGLVHGMTLLSMVGVVLGWRTRRMLAGAIGGAATGLVAAAAFYGVVGVLGFAGALVAAWMLLWLLFAALGAWLERRPVLGREAWARGVLAAVTSGVAFWLVSGMWTRHEAGGPDYPWNFVSWTFAFFPGFAALVVRRQAVQPSATNMDAERGM
jgi:hypothetical protein